MKQALIAALLLALTVPAFAHKPCRADQHLISMGRGGTACVDNPK